MFVGNFADVDVSLSAAGLAQVINTTSNGTPAGAAADSSGSSSRGGGGGGAVVVLSYLTRAPANLSVVTAQGLDPSEFILTEGGTVVLTDENATVRLPAYSLTTFRWETWEEPEEAEEEEEEEEEEDSHQ